MKCEDCKWWDKNEKYPESKSGMCRRNAPRLIVASCGIGENPLYENDWPTTMNCEWCGEFKQKGENLNETSTT